MLAISRVRWKWSLPIAQLVFAIACHIYDTHAYRVRAYRDQAVNNFEYYRQNKPAWPVRLSSGINFPVLVLNYPFRAADNPVIYERNGEFTAVAFGLWDVEFFCGVVLLWYGVGRRLDGATGGEHRTARLAGFVFGIATGACALHMICSARRPEVEIGTLGMGWALALTGYFAWRLAFDTN